MSQIVEAIDAEIGEEEEHLAGVLAQRDQLSEKIERLRDMRQLAVSLNGGGKMATEAPPRSMPEPKRSTKRRNAKQAAAPKVTDTDRAKRAENGDKDKALVLSFIREHGEVTYAQAAELFGVSIDTAKKRLARMAATSGLGVYDGKRPAGAKTGRPPKVYRLNATGSTTAGGAKTNTERKILDSVTTDGPIDAGTLAFNVGMNTNDTRKVVDGLVNRGVLKRRTDEGVTLYEVAS